MLPRPKRLTKQRDFLKLAAVGHTVFGPIATLRVRQIVGQPPKVAFITSTKVFKKAVDRNRAKRRMREAVAQVWDKIPTGMHLLFILKPESRDADWLVLKAEVERLISRIPEALAKPAKPSSRAAKHSSKMARPKPVKQK